MTEKQKSYVENIVFILRKINSNEEITLEEIKEKFNKFFSEFSLSGFTTKLSKIVELFFRFLFH